MKITSMIIDGNYIMGIEGAIVGIHADELNKVIRSTNPADLGITKIIMDFRQVSMIDSIGLEAINHAQKQGLKISIFNAQELVKDMLERAVLTKRLSPFLQIVGKDRRLSHRKEVLISTRVPVSC